MSKHRKHRILDLVEKERDLAIKKVLKEVHNAKDHLIESVKDQPFLPLFPFKGVMKNALKRANIPYDNSLHGIVQAFVQNIAKVKIANNFEAGYGHYFEHAQSFGADGLPDHLDFSFEPHHVDYAVIVEQAIKIVSDFISGLQKKKAAGEKLTPDEDKILKEAQQVSNQVVALGTEKAKDASASMIRDFLFSWKGATLGAVILAFIIWKVVK